MNRFTRIVGWIFVFTVLIASVAYPWGSTGHRIINLKAAMHLPSTMGQLKTDSLFYWSHASDADNRKVGGDTTFFNEEKRHYIDIDNYPFFRTMPHRLDSVIAKYGYAFVKQQGTLPWAIAMEMDSLTAQLHRGDNAKAEYTMADLGHYVADGHQPLHCTANYDGWQTGNSGIHSRYESSMITMYQSYISIHRDTIQYIASLVDYAFDFIIRSNSLVTSILNADNYAKSASGWDGSGTAPASYYDALWQQTGTMTIDQFQRATVAIASLWYTAWVNSQATAVADEYADDVPVRFSISQNYPNPFNPFTIFDFRLPIESRVSLKVYDMLGREVATLLNEMRPAGEYTVRWDASDSPSGVYFYRINAVGQDGILFYTQIGRMILAR